MNAAQQARIARLELLARAHPDSRVVLHLAEAHRRAGQLEQALHVLEEGLARQPDDAAARVLLGRVLLDLGRWAEAQSAFRAALAGQPERMEIVALRALGELAALWRSDAALGKAARGERDATPPQRPGAAQPVPPAAARGAAAAARADTRTALPLNDLPWEEMMLVTETLAELYAAQGLTGQAIALYRELLAIRPDDARIRERLRALTREHESGPERGAAPVAEATTSPELAGERPADLARAAAAEGLEISFVRMAQPMEATADAAPPAPPDPGPTPETAAAPADAPRPEPAPAHAPAIDDLDWLFTPGAAPPVVASADAWAHLTALADLALDALDERRAGNTAAARHVRRLARATAHELGMDSAAVAVLELAAQLLGIAVPAGAPAGASAGAWIAAAVARLDPLDLPADVLEVLRHAATLDDGAHDVTLAARVLAAAIAFRAELARRGPARVRALREAGAALWHDEGQRYGREVIAALLGAVARDPTLAFPIERRVLVLGADDIEAAAIAQPFRAAGDRVVRARSLDRARPMLSEAGDYAVVVVLPDVGADGVAHFARELAATMKRARPVVVATGIGDAGSRTALLAAGADLCFGPGTTTAEVHAATAALLRRLGEAGGDDGAAVAAAPEPAGRTGVRAKDREGID